MLLEKSLSRDESKHHFLHEVLYIFSVYLLDRVCGEKTLKGQRFLLHVLLSTLKFKSMVSIVIYELLVIYLF